MKASKKQKGEKKGKDFKISLRGRHPEGLRTWIEIDTAAMKHNMEIFSGLLQDAERENMSGKKTLLMSVVKSNAYGHDLVSFSKKMEQLGADFLGVDSITEAVRLRKEKIKIPILVLGYTLPENFALAEKNRIDLTLSSFDQLSLFAKYTGKKPIRVHVKIDTGMHRQGFFPEDAEKLPAMFKKTPQIKIAGMYTHFANGKNPSFPHDSKQQMERFERAVRALETAGFSGFLKHAGATSGTILYPEYHFDMVRVGIGMYGLWPSEETRRAYEEKFQLMPVLSWKTVVSEIKMLPKGESIGYDFTETFRQQTTIAILPLGYWHGFVRAFSSVGNVLVKGQRARVLGRVSMDMVAVDITDIPGVAPHEVVTLLGKDGTEEITAEELGKFSGTTNYEVVTRLNPKMKRIHF